MFRWIKDFLQTLFPDACLACQKALREREKELCTSCRLHLPLTNHHLERDNAFLRKFGTDLPIEHALAYLKFQKQGATQKIIHALKYYENQEIGKLIGRWYGNTLREHGYQFDLLLPVPLHKNKLALRGYNQSDCFAEGLAEGLQTEWNGALLTRNKNTDSQTRKGRQERWENVARIFETATPEQLAGKRVAIVDDVVTTGSTLNSCAHTVFDCEAASVSLVAIAIAGEDL